MCPVSFSSPPTRFGQRGKLPTTRCAWLASFEKGFNFVVTLCALYHAVLLFLPLLLHALFKHLTILFNRNIVEIDVLEPTTQIQTNFETVIQCTDTYMPFYDCKRPDKQRCNHDFCVFSCYVLT